MQAPKTIPTKQHLYELYPQIPQFSNDPEQSELIYIYDLINKRFQGLYSNQPLFFVKSPAYVYALGSPLPSIQSPTLSFPSLQNVIVAICPNSHTHLRVNHYQSAVYGQKVYENQSIKWKYDENSDEYTNLLTCSLKAYALTANNHTLKGADILIYDDFVQDQHLYSKQAISLSLAVALHAVNSNNGASEQFCRKYLQKVGNLTPIVRAVDLPILNSYGKMKINNILQQNSENVTKQINFPQDLQIIFAHSMTPLAKKMTKGKRDNLRASQIQIGIQIIKNQIGATNHITSLRQLQKYLNCTTSQLLQNVEQYIPKGPLTAQKIQHLVQKPLIQLLKHIPYANNVVDENLTFLPYNRIRFYLLEQLTIQNLSQNINGDGLVEAIQTSHKNGKELLDIGSEQTSEMQKVFQNLAKAWKIVGGGWGGYMMILCETQKMEQIVQGLVEKFYTSEQNRVLLSDDIDQYIKIVGKPASGIGILDPKSEIWY